jgi:hypothetical protein
MIQIQLEPEVEAQLATEARARGMALEHYIVEKLSGAHPASRQDVAAAIETIRRLRRGNTLGGLTTKELVGCGRGTWL